MAAELIKLYPENPETRKINRIVDVLRDGGLVVYPTDTVYGLGCDLLNHRSVERIQKLRNSKRNGDLSFICYDLSEIANYARVETPVFKLMKRTLPGPYTFILKSSSQVPKILNARKKTVGIRVPDNLIPRELVRVLGRPILSASIKDKDEVIGYTTDPELIYDTFKHDVDIVIDGGYSGNEPSTVVDCSQGEIEIIREGKGDPDNLY